MLVNVWFVRVYEKISHVLYPGENDGYMVMNYHGLPWTTMVVHCHITMENNGRPCFVKWHHGI